MPIDLQQTDDAAACSIAAFCSGRSVSGGTTQTANASSGGTAGATEESVTINASETTVVGYHVDTPAIGTSTWAAGTYTVRLNISSGAGSSKLTLEEIHICRVDSSCTSQASVGSVTGLSTGLKNPITITQAISGSAQAASSSDKLVFVFVFTNGDAMTNLTIGITPDQIINTPIVQATRRIFIVT